MAQIEKYIKRLKTLQNLYEEGQPQHNAFGIAIVEANEMLVKNFSIPSVINSGKNTCPDCDDRGWLYDDDGRRTGTCPCHY